VQRGAGGRAGGVPGARRVVLQRDGGVGAGPRRQEEDVLGGEARLDGLLVERRALARNVGRLALAARQRAPRLDKGAAVDEEPDVLYKTKESDGTRIDAEKKTPFFTVERSLLSCGIFLAATYICADIFFPQSPQALWARSLSWTRARAGR
jgi:hypothetical protein